MSDQNDDFTFVIQARTGSTRFPNKILHKFHNYTLLELIVLRIKKGFPNYKIIIATSNNINDDILCDFVNEHNVNLYRGNENDVLERLYESAKEFNAKNIIRIPSDNPLIPNAIIKRSIIAYQASDVDYCSTTLNKNFPIGIHVEVFSMNALKIAHQKSLNRVEREHVTPYIYNNPNLFKIKMVEELVDYSDSYFTIDYESDLKIIEEIAFSLDNIFEFDMIELYRLFKKLKFSHKLLNHNKKAIIEKINYE